MIIKTISCFCYMTYEHCINKPMQMLKRRLNMVIAKNPQLISSLDQNKQHPLITKSSHIPFND